MNGRTPPTSVRFRFAKLGKVRFTSHRDVARVWERALRRACLPVAMTEGFNPRVKVHFGLALPTGYTSLGEYVEVDFRPDELDAESLGALPDLLTPLLPPGLTVQAAAPVEPGAESLQQAVTCCGWRVEVIGLTPPEARAATERVLAADKLPVARQRKGREVTDDIRPYIRDVSVLGTLPEVHRRAGTVLSAELGTQPRGLRPSEMLAVLAGDSHRLVLTADDLLGATADGLPVLEEGTVCRTHQWIEGGGMRHEPLVAPAAQPAQMLTAGTHAEQRAS